MELKETNSRILLLMDVQEGKTVIRKLASYYRSGKANLGKDFFSPCLKYSYLYRRAVGYFSSGALIAWADAIPRIATDNIKIQLIISPELSPEDRIALERLTNESEQEKLRQVIADQIIKDSLKLSDNTDSSYLRQQLLAWMVANDKLILKFAFPVHLEAPGIFHEKIGIFNFIWGDCVAFTGSANESLNGHSRNYESIDVYRSWVAADEERVKNKIEEFEEAWIDQAVGLKLVNLSQEVIDFIRDYAPIQRPDIVSKSEAKVVTHSINPCQSQESNYRWRHQQKAVEKFLQVRHGVLEMATGTGKTRTALEILTRLNQQNKIEGIIISTVGNDLLDQWCKEVERWSIGCPRPFRVLKDYESYHQLESFANNPRRAVIVISREKLGRLLRRLPALVREKLIIIHDEVHGLGSPAIRQDLAGQHESFSYRLGLSATPEREYDQEGTKFIFDEIGDVFFQFSLKDAIERGILCEFDYIPLAYQLTDADKYRLRQVHVKKSIRKKQGNPMSETEVWIELSKVYKTAEQKPAIFADFLQSNPQILQSTIIFVENQDYGNELLETIHSYTHRYRTYYSGEDKQNLKDFASGKIDCLITCHRISQGIDIKSLQNVILFSSARTKLETIQRIGRCLRTNPQSPNKRATVVDFVLQPDENESDKSVDDDRFQWLTELSKFQNQG